MPAQAPVGTAAFSGYASGAVLAAGAVEPSNAAGVVRAALAFSTASVGSPALGQPASDELGLPLRPPAGEAKTYGRGGGVEVTVAGLPLAGDGAPLPSGTAAAAAPPSSALHTREVTPVPSNRLVFASLLRGQAQPQWSDQTCVLGQPLAFGLGYAADARILDLGGTGSLAALEGGTPPDRAAAQSRSFTYLLPNGDGTFGLASETRQTVAPVTVFGGTAEAVTIEVLGELALRVVATGKPGGAEVVHSVAGGGGPATPILRLTAVGQTQELTLQQVLGPEPVTLSLGPALRAVVGGGPRRPAAAGRSADGITGPEEAPDGTRAAAAVDLVRVTAVHQPPAVRPRLVEVRLGHMEATAAVPRGGVRCPLPVAKSGAPDSVEPGDTFTWTISIPPTPGALDAVACDLVDIRAVDVARASTGVGFTLMSASHAGQVEGGEVRWEHLGDYTRGDPPIILVVTGRVTGGSSAGVLTDTVVVEAGLGRCTGGAAGEAVAGGSPARNRAAFQGSFTLWGPTAAPADGALQ